MGPILNPGELFERWAAAGSDFLERIRAEVTEPEKRKRLRRWGIQEAARLIGRSAQTIRQAEASDPRFAALGPPSRDNSGHRAYTLAQINQYRDLFGTRNRRPPGSRAVRCAVTNFKGGAGKTTTAVHLAQKSALEGLRTLLVDLDPQATTTLLLGLLPYIHVKDTVGEVLVDNPSLLRNVIVPTYFTGLDLVPANLTLQDAELQLANPNIVEQRSGMLVVERLKHALDSVEEEYDVVVMDCGPNLGILTLNAVTAATGLLIPMPPAMADFGSANLFCHTMQNLLADDRFNRSLEFIRILITRHTGSVEAKNTEAMIRLAFAPCVLDPVMVQTVEIERVTNDFGTIYDIETPRGSADAYRRAMASVEAANAAMIEVFREVWAQQALRAG